MGFSVAARFNPPHQYRALVLLAVFDSLRWGELMGLCRGDLDLDEALVRVARSVVEMGRRLVTRAPKTAAGIRMVAVASWLVPELRKHLDAFAEPGEDGRIFVGVRGSTPSAGNSATTWRQGQAKAALLAKLHFHDLRTRIAPSRTLSTCSSAGWKARTCDWLPVPERARGS